MSSERLFAVDVSDKFVSGLLCEAGRRTLTPLVSDHCEIDSDENYLVGAEQVIQSCGAKNCRCYLALPASIFYFKNLTLPFTDLAKVNQILPYELQDSISFGDQQFEFDAVVGENTDSGTRLLAALIERAKLTPWRELIAGHGMALEIVTVSPHSRLLQIDESSTGHTDSFMYLDAGRSESAFFLMKNGRVGSIRALPGAADGSHAELLDEFDRTLRIWEASAGTLAELPLMIGGTAAEKIDTEWFKETFLSPDVKVLDSAQLSISRDQALQMPPAHLLSRLQGLAAMNVKDKRLLNLQKPESLRSAGSGVLRKLAPAIMVLLTMLILFSGWQIYEYRKMTLERARLVHEAEEIYSQTMDGKKPVTDPVLDLKSRIKEIDQSVIASIVENPEIRVETLLSDLSTRLPPSVRVSFERFSFDRRKVRIDGLTLSYNDVDRIKKSLEQSPLYSGVSIDSAGNRQDGSGVRFSMTLHL